MKKIATLAVAGLLGLGLATAADAQQRPMGASGSSGSSMSQSMPVKSSMPAKKSAAKKSSMNAGSVKAVQTALNKNGAMLKVDGKMGKATRDALKKYQSAHGLKSTGRLDDATRTTLGV
jgi:peptidoglycan hydrolase-like protein with peptidoglycan-binding domain